MACFAPGRKHLFNKREHRVLVKAVSSSVGLTPAMHFKLTARLHPFDVDSALSQPRRCSLARSR